MFLLYVVRNRVKENRLPRLLYHLQLLCISSGNLELFDTDGECILRYYYNSSCRQLLCEAVWEVVYRVSLQRMATHVR